MSEDLKTVIESLKSLVRENDGEIPYWGEEIEVSLREPALAGTKQSHGTMSQNGPVDNFKYGNGIATPSAPSGLQARNDNSLRLLDFYRNEIGDCHLCLLGDTRNKLVFGVGNPEARVMLIGEGPGYEEDRQGEPFVGKAGQLLDKILGSIGLDRTKVYIANIVKCHPMVDPKKPDLRGNDRPPLPEEMDKCISFLKKQIGIIRPQIIVTLGAVATKALLNTYEGITKIRGRWREAAIVPGLPPFKVLPTYHPAALLRNPELKRDVWEDMKLLRAALLSN